MKNVQGNRLQSDQELYMCRLHEIVERSIKEQNLLIQNLSNPPVEASTMGQRISDKVARFGGSWKFIILFISILFVWICFNAIAIQRWRFDPYPFILMNLVLSCIAALQAPIIMMSQNRQEEKDRKESEDDYMINMKAEMQIRSLHEKMDLLEEQQIKTLFDTQAKQFELLAAINKKLDHII
ncbi:MAG: DUF1003 domain-containing protein, partial [Chitinophagaceae bacterium]